MAIFDSLRNALNQAKVFMYHSDNCSFIPGVINCDCGYFVAVEELELAYKNLVLFFKG